MIEQLIRAIKGKQAEIAFSLTAGYVVNFETYQRLVGKHEGLQDALNEIEKLLEEEK